MKVPLPAVDAQVRLCFPRSVKSFTGSVSVEFHTVRWCPFMNSRLSSMAVSSSGVSCDFGHFWAAKKEGTWYL